MLGQTGVEYLMLFTLVLTILSILTYYAQDMTQRNMEEIIVSGATIAVNKIVDASDIVYTQGKPSQVSLSVYVPDKVYSIEFSNNRMIMRINISSGSSDIFATSKAQLKGNISTISGTKKIRVKAEKNVTTGVTYVNITEG